MSDTPPPPPVQPVGEPAPAPRSTWPTAVGIIAIVFGVLGMLGACSSAMGPALMNLLKDKLPPQQRQGMEVMGEWSGYMLAIAVPTLILAALLLALGVGILKRSPKAAKGARVWAVLKIILVVCSAYGGYRMQEAQFEAMRQAPAGPGVPPPGVLALVSRAGLAFSVVWGWALPVFFLVWFKRPKIRAEVAEWS